jgi:hypothetical protein
MILAQIISSLLFPNKAVLGGWPPAALHSMYLYQQLQVKLGCANLECNKGFQCSLPVRHAIQNM